MFSLWWSSKLFCHICEVQDPSSTHFTAALKQHKWLWTSGVWRVYAAQPPCTTLDSAHSSKSSTITGTWKCWSAQGPRSCISCRGEDVQLTGMSLSHRLGGKHEGPLLVVVVAVPIHGAVHSLSLWEQPGVGWAGWNLVWAGWNLVWAGWNLVWARWTWQERSCSSTRCLSYPNRTKTDRSVG